jgi:hypothetical protein
VFSLGRNLANEVRFIFLHAFASKVKCRLYLSVLTFYRLSRKKRQLEQIVDGRSRSNVDCILTNHVPPMSLAIRPLQRKGFGECGLCGNHGELLSWDADLGSRICQYCEPFLDAAEKCSAKILPIAHCRCVTKPSACPISCVATARKLVPPGFCGTKVALWLYFTFRSNSKNSTMSSGGLILALAKSSLSCPMSDLSFSVTASRCPSDNS